MFDAYTIKKVLPRLVAAAVLIQLSWFIFTGMIRLTAAVSYGIESLIAIPFGGLGALSLENIIAASGLGAGGTTLGFATAAVIGYFAAGGILAFAILVILSLLVGFLALIIRKILIVALLLLSPIALVAWILPGTERFWKMWWDNFIKLLLMFPLILIMLVAGRVFALVTAESDIVGPGFLEMAIVLIAVFAPIALIPLTFRVAGAGLGAIAGVIKQRGDGIAGGFADRRRKTRAEKWANRRKDLSERASESRLFNPQGRFGRFNNLASTVVDPKNAARIALGTRGGKSLLSQIGQAKWDHTEKLAGVLSKAGFNDRALKSLGKWDGSEQKLNEEIARLQNTGDHNDQIAAQLLQNNSGFLLNAHRSEEYGRASIHGAAGLALAGQGFASPDDIASTATELNKEFPGLGNTFKTSAELASAQRGGLSKPGYTVTADGEGGFSAAGLGLQIKRLESLGVQDIAGAKGPQLAEYEDAYRTALSGQSYTGTNGEVTQVSDQTAQTMRETLMQAYTSYTNPDIKNRVRNILVDSAVARGGVSREEAITKVNNELEAMTRVSPDKVNQLSGNEPPPPPPGVGPPPG